MRGFVPWLESELEDLDAAHRLRACPALDGPSRTSPQTPFGPLLSFCSNDYLGLANHPHLAAAAARAADEQGFGASASRLVSGDLEAHRALDQALAGFTQRPAALAFPTGYQTNVGVIAALARSGDLIVSDAANHASLIDGCRLSRATIAIYPHADAAGAEAALGRAGDFRRRFLVTESLFSMDGDRAPLAALARAATEHDAVLIVDEAHALGTLGPQGRGLCAELGIEPDVLIGTLGKAVGAAGGFAAGAPALRSFLVNRARTFIYTTAPPAPVAAAAVAGLALLASEEGDRRRARLAENRDRLTAAVGRLGLLSSAAHGPIIPIIFGADDRALAASETLRARGLFVPAIRPPTVPPGTARLRVTLSSAHQPADIDRLADALRTCRR